MMRFPADSPDIRDVPYEAMKAISDMRALGAFFG